MANEPLIVSGDGSQFREYIHISDLVAAHDLVLSRNDVVGETINFGTSESVAIRTIAKLIANRLNTTVVNGPARLGEVPGFEMGSSKAIRLGFSPGTKFNDGLERYIEWRLGNKTVGEFG